MPDIGVFDHDFEGQHYEVKIKARFNVRYFLIHISPYNQ